jgi:phosphinothricin acetyltransferase
VPLATPADGPACAAVYAPDVTDTSISLGAVLTILRLQGLHSILAGVTPPNPGSVRLHEALGFERIGLFEEVGWKDGRWHRVEFFALELSPADRTPLPIRSLPEIAGSGELERVLANATA